MNLMVKMVHKNIKYHMEKSLSKRLVNATSKNSFLYATSAACAQTF